MDIAIFSTIYFDKKDNFCDFFFVFCTSSPFWKGVDP